MPPQTRKRLNKYRILLAISVYYVIVGQLSPVIVKPEVQNILGYVTLFLLLTAAFTITTLMKEWMIKRPASTP